VHPGPFYEADFSASYLGGLIFDFGAEKVIFAA